MAELDTRLPLALQPVPFPDARQVVGDLLNARAASQQGTLNDLLIEKAQRDQAQEAERRAAFAQFGQAQGGGTLGAAGQAPPLPAVAAQAGAVPASQVAPGGTLPGLMLQETPAAPGQTLGALGGAQQPSQRRAQDVLVQRLFMTNPEQALQMQEFFNTQDVAKLEQNKLQLETLRTSMSVGGQLLSGVDDQASYDLVKRDLRRIVQRLGRNPALVPDLYTPETVEQLRSQASDLETQAAQLSTETDQQIDTLKAETSAGKLALEQEKEQRKIEDVPRQRDIEERETRAREMQAQAAVARAGEGSRSAKERERKRRGEIRGQVLREPAFKDFSGARQAFNIIKSGVAQKSNFGDLALINGFARLLDPGSVVRPSEFETVRSVQPIVSRLEVLLPRIKAGEQLTPRDRASVERAANAIMKEYIQTVRDELNPVFGPIAREAGIPLGELFHIPDTPAPTTMLDTTIQRALKAPQ